MATPKRSVAPRRDFLKAGAVALSALPIVSGGVYAQGSDVLKIGLVGCGGRGSGAAAQALRADKAVSLHAMGDMFGDRLEGSLNSFNKDKELAGKINVGDKKFLGFDAYKKVIDSGVDVVLLTTPPHFRAQQIKYAIEKGKHVFAEKPVAVDATGVRSVLESCKQAKAKNLAVVSGLCWRYHYGKRETMARIHEGQIGDIVAMHTNYVVGGLWHRKREPEWSDMEWQLRNWLYFTWLSGDHIVEQHIHSLDKCMWAMKDEPPISAMGLGGRQVRVSTDFGHIFDHHAVVYEWKNGAKAFSYTRQQDGCFNEVNDYLMGTQGTCDVMKHQIKGKNPWVMKKRPQDDMYQNEHNELFASIRAGKPINDGEWMCQSTLMAIMGRMATYTGKLITWDMAWNSKEDLTPAKYELGMMPMPEVARPGITKFV